MELVYGLFIIFLWAKLANGVPHGATMSINRLGLEVGKCIAVP